MNWVIILTRKLTNYMAGTHLLQPEMRALSWMVAEVFLTPNSTNLTLKRAEQPKLCIHNERHSEWSGGNWKKAFMRHWI